MQVVLSLGLLCVLFSIHAEAAINCRDLRNQPVDWWAILKVPHLPDSNDTAAASGYAYAYADSNNQYFSYSDRRLDDGAGPVDFTLNQIYTHYNNNTVAYLMYDDESADGKSHDDYGHTKGDIAFDKTSGFWLVHSVPRYPGVPDGFGYPGYPHDEIDYGQSFLCVTYNTNTFNTIGNQLLLNKPWIYSSQLPSALASAVPSIQSAINGQWSTQSSNIVTLKSQGGSSFVSFAKSEHCDCDLYETVVSPYYKCGLYVETWMDGSLSNKMPTYCTPKYKYDSINIRSVNIGFGIDWGETKDHSKWCISETKCSSKIVCIGDINRQFSQAKRGGGTVCTTNSNMWTTFNNLIEKMDSC